MYILQIGKIQHNEIVIAVGIQLIVFDGDLRTTPHGNKTYFMRSGRHAVVDDMDAEARVDLKDIVPECIDISMADSRLRRGQVRDLFCYAFGSIYRSVAPDFLTGIGWVAVIAVRIFPARKEGAGHQDPQIFSHIHGFGFF